MKMVYGFVILVYGCIWSAYAQVYPAPEKPVIDDYFGQKVEDPYRYMENVEDSEFHKWLKAQSDHARRALNNIPGREDLIAKMQDFDQRKSVSITNLTITDNDRYFYLKQTPNDETGKLYYRNGLSGKETLLYDPKDYKTEDQSVHSLNFLYPNLDGSKICFAISSGGSENNTILIMDVDKKRLYAETISPCWFIVVSWLTDGNSFFYNKMNSNDINNPERYSNTKVLYHRLGTNPEQDKEIFSSALYPELDIKPEEIPLVHYNDKHDKLIGITMSSDKHFKAFWASSDDLDEQLRWHKFFGKEDEIVMNLRSLKNPLRVGGESIYAVSSKDAPNYKIIKTDVDNPDFKHPETLVPERKSEVLQDFIVSKSGIYYTTLRNGVEARLHFKEHNGTEETIPLPFSAGNIAISGKGIRSDDIWVSLTGWTRGESRYRYNATTKEFITENLSPLAEYPEFEDLVVEEIMIPSHDGVMVPLSLIYKKDLKKDGSNPVLLHGYGAYGFSRSPNFRPNYLLWTLQNGIYAVAHVRGGGELGESWHLAGKKENKPNSWKDFIACAEYMHRKKYSTSDLTAIMGGSAGGLLVGRAMTERPNLFKVAIALVGAMNPLRLEETPSGPINIPEFGSASNESEYEALIEMDPYLHIEDGKNYPATLLTAGMNDPRLIVWQPAKFAARLQKANTSDNPVLFRVDYEAGHGSRGHNKSQEFEDIADRFSFALWQMGRAGYQARSK